MSIPEFLEFFTTPSQVRVAKAATAAVRMSLSLLALTADEELFGQQGDEEEEEEEEKGKDAKDNDADENVGLGAKVTISVSC